MEKHFHFHITINQSQVEKKIDLLGEIMSAQFDALKAQVAANKSVEDSVIVLLQGISAKLANATTAEDIAAVTADLKAQTDALAGAVTANTPAA